MGIGGRRESILVWDEEEDDLNVDEESERMPRERWDEWLVLGSGWLYKQDIRIEESDAGNLGGSRVPLAHCVVFSIPLMKCCLAGRRVISGELKRARRERAAECAITVT
jgi:hypothetical protein